MLTLGPAFLWHRRKPTCLPRPGNVHEPVLVAASHCESCGGRDNRRAVERMLPAMRRVGLGKLLVATVRPAIAGSPNGSVPARSSGASSLKKPDPTSGPSRRCSIGPTLQRSGRPPRLGTRRRQCRAAPRCSGCRAGAPLHWPKPWRCGVGLSQLETRPQSCDQSANRVGKCGVGQQSTSARTEGWAQRPGEARDQINGCHG